MQTETSCRWLVAQQTCNKNIIEHIFDRLKKDVKGIVNCKYLIIFLPVSV